MARSLVIVGNGLGMALDAHYFSLESGLTDIWNNAEYLNERHKDLIQTAISGTSLENPPCSEEQLDKLQVAIIATEFLCSFELNGVAWVSEAAKELPSVFRKYIHEVALYFHRSRLTLPESFLAPLSDFVHRTKSHVATLNYDNLLYDAFVQFGVLRGYDGPLLDGFWNKTGFDESNLDRWTPAKHGWYLHLHGSPLYVGNRKITGAGRDFLDPAEESHIVLAHVEHKPLLIESSHILSAYWRRLEKAFDESERITLFGYSGLDTHLNNRIKLRTEKEIRVIEWAGNAAQEEREAFWSDLLSNGHLEVRLFENILDFSDWD